MLGLLLATLAILGPFMGLHTSIQLSGVIPQDALLPLRASALPAIIAVPFANRFLARIPSAHRLLIAFTVAIAASVALAVLPVSAWTAGVCMFAIAVTVSIAAPAMIETVMPLALPHRGAGTALYAFALFLGASIAPQIVGATGIDLSQTALASAVVLAVAGGAIAVLSRARLTALAFGAASVTVTATLVGASTLTASAATTQPEREHLTMQVAQPRIESAPHADALPPALRIPEGFVLVSERHEFHNDIPVIVRRYERGVKVNYGREHVTTVTARDTGTLLGYTRQQATGDPATLPAPDEAERLAYELINEIDPEYAAGLTTQWVDRHDETIVDETGTERTVAGIKVKTRHGNGLYTWVILGENGEVITYERDVRWNAAEARRATAMWLHDRWIIAHDGKGEPPAPPAASI